MGYKNKVPGLERRQGLEWVALGQVFHPRELPYFSLQGGRGPLANPRPFPAVTAGYWLENFGVTQFKQGMCHLDGEAQDYSKHS